MAKVAIKNENITSFGGIYHIMDVFSKLGFEKLTESVLDKRGSSGKAFCYGSIFGSLFFSYLCGGEYLEDINALTGPLNKYVDSFRIVLTEEAKLCVKQKDSQDGFGYLLYYHPPMQKTFSCQYFETVDNSLKNHDIISGKIPTDKGKNTCKKQVCNRQ